MRRLHVVVFVWCVAAALTALGWGPIEDRLEAATRGEGPTDDRQTDLDRLLAAAVDVEELPGQAVEAMIEDCLEVSPDADPALSPALDDVEVRATGTTSAAGIVVWLGSAPEIEAAVGSCVVLETEGEWHLVNRGHRADSGRPSLVWGQHASGVGSAASLVGRVEEEARAIVVWLTDDRVLRQAVDGYAAIAWTPVAAPVRVVVLGAGDAVLFDGELTDY